MTLPLVMFASQLADGLGYVLVHGRGTELNPVAAFIDNPLTLLLIKVVLGLVLTIGAFALVRAGRSRAVAWLSVVGFVGAWTEVAAL
jgi:hypothetical protein